MKLLRLTEPEADCSGQPQTRTVEIRKGQSLRRGSSPVLLEPGGTFQITANSEVNGHPRHIQVDVTTEADCSGRTHPTIQWKDSEDDGVHVEKKHKLGFYRQPFPGDNSQWGFFAMLNAAFAHSPVQYPIAASSCGFPNQPGGGSVEGLDAVIEVFPGDQYSAELSFPAFLKPDSLEYSKASESWTTQRERDQDKIKEAGEKAEEEADQYYESEKEFYNDFGSSKAEFRQFAEDMEKRKLGYVEGNPEGLKIQLSQTDGHRTLQANVDEVIKLIQLIRKAEYRFKEFNEWLDSFQVGPGVHFKVGCQFLVLKFSAKWGYTEYVDDRVFLRFSVSADIDIIKAELDVSLGFKSAGLCDLLLVLKGEGTLGLTVPEFTRETPDDAPKAKVKPRGELKIGGGVEGTAMWIAKASGIVQVTFKAETEDLHILSDEGVLSGKIVVSREPLEAIVTASCWLYGTRTKKVELVKADPDLAHFSF